MEKDMFDKVNLKDTLSRDELTRFKAMYGFTRYEYITLAEDCIIMILDHSITEEHAANIFKDMDDVERLETITGYYERLPEERP